MPFIAKNTMVPGPKPEGLVKKGNIDLTKRPRALNPDGSVSTVLSASFNFGDGKETLVPTISPKGEFLTERQAGALYKKTGKHLGKFSTPEQASAYARRLHVAQDEMYKN